jgi:phospholipase D1/2
MAEVTARATPTGKLFDEDSLSLRQIVDNLGAACKAYAAQNVWVGGAYPFSMPRTGNAVTAFTTGRDYFAHLADAIPTASRVLYIAGWQVNWDAELKPGTRLFDVVLKAAQNNKHLKVYVMPWKHSPPQQTYDGQTQAVLEGINGVVGRACVTVTRATSLADEDAGFFSHHQKLVVIDEKVAYIGGMDLAYGRFDDATYDLRANAAGRTAMNRYNGCIPHLGHVPASQLVNPDLLTGAVDNHPTMWGLWSSNHSETMKQIQGGPTRLRITMRPLMFPP